MQEEIIDFSKISAPSDAGYLEPGMYRLKVDPDNTTVVAAEGKKPYLAVKFVDQKGNSLTEKFYLTAKAMERLQYLHEAWFNKSLTEKFKSYLEIGEYFKKALTVKIVSRPMVVGGKLTADGKFYSGLPYKGFVIVDEKQFEEGAFDKDSESYKRVVKVETANPLVANTNAAILPQAEGPGGYTPVDDGIATPW